MAVILALLGTAWLAWSNGANDNFKGVATLYGSRSLTYRAAMVLAALATLGGGILAIDIADGLVRVFAGGGLVDGGPLSQATLAATAVAAAATIALATVLGMPTSTTHALFGALVGAAGVLAPGSVRGGALISKFAQPMFLSPLLAFGAASAVGGVLRLRRRRACVEPSSCICVGDAPAATVADAGGVAAMSAPTLVVRVGTVEACEQEFGSGGVKLDVALATRTVHVLSAGAVCFARAVNDTPKIAGLALAAGAAGVAFTPHAWVAIVTAAMVLGGVVQGRRVALTMGDRITRLDEGQALSANVVTSILVLGASRLGLPVSTTHVSCGAIFGAGAVNGRIDRRIVTRIMLAWVTTLPLALALGAGLRLALGALGV